MAKTQLGSNTQFTGASKSLVVVGDWCYAYSESLAFDNNPAITLLEFSTGKQIIKAHFLPYRTDTDSLDSQHEIYFNGIEVFNMNMASGTSHANSILDNSLIIPPLTHVKVTIINTSNTSTGTGACSMVGRIYDA